MIKGNVVILREKIIGDALNDYTWESDPELSYLDATEPISMTFSHYMSEYTEQLRSCPPTSRRLAIETLENKHIGNCSYYNISETRRDTELGIMIGDRDYWNQGYGADTINTLTSYVFSQTNINRIYLKTLESNRRAQSCFHKCGFNTYGRKNINGFRFKLMEISRGQWQEKKKQAQSELPL